MYVPGVKLQLSGSHYANRDEVNPAELLKRKQSGSDVTESGQQIPEHHTLAKISWILPQHPSLQKSFHVV